MSYNQHSVDEAHYQLRVKGHIAGDWFASLCEVRVLWEDDGATRIVARLPDQAALHGLLARVRDLGLTLLSVERG
jgi:hypothetical protein